MDARSARHRLALYVILASPGLVALVSPYLPFQDWPGHLGIVGALVHRDDPAAHMADFFTYRSWWGPNRLLYAIIVGLAHLVPASTAGMLGAALSLAALGPATAYLCRSLDEDEALAVFALPLALGRHVYCGFVANALALALLVFTLGAVFGYQRRPALGRFLWFLVGLVLLQQAHEFIYLAGSGLIFLSVLPDLLRRAPREGPRSRLEAPNSRRTALGLLGALLLSFGLLLSSFETGGKDVGGGSWVLAILQAIRSEDRGHLLRSFWEWLFASYRYSKVDDVLQALWGALFLGVLGSAVGADVPRLASRRGRLVAAALVTLAMFALLPSWIGPPVNWWAANMRLPVIAVLLLIPVAGRGIWRRSPRVRGVCTAICLVPVLLATADIFNFGRTEMAGLDEVIAAIPPGLRISALHFTPNMLYEYPGEPHGYLGNYYLLQKGGMVAQDLSSNPGVPIAKRIDGPAPPWGSAAAFSWPLHGPFYDGFLVRIDPVHPDAPFSEVKDQVRLEKAAGNFRYYSRKR